MFSRKQTTAGQWWCYCTRRSRRIIEGSESIGYVHLQFSELNGRRKPHYLHCLSNACRLISLCICFVAATVRWAQNGVTVAGGHGAGDAPNGPRRPWGLTVDEESTVIIANFDNHRVVEWKQGATSGTVLAGGNGRGERSDQLNQPTDVIVDKATESLIICDAGNRRVTRWSRRSGTRSGETIINNIDCYGLSMDAEGSLYVSDVKNDEVRRYRRGETAGIVVANGNGKGEGLHQLNFPTHVCVDGEHAVYVSDMNNHRVMKWTKDAKEGIIVAGGRGQGKDLMQLYYPHGVMVDEAGTVYVADHNNGRVMRWCHESTHGAVVVGGNGHGKGANQFKHPTGLCFDRHGHLYVADESNNRVQRFSLEKN